MTSREKEVEQLKQQEDVKKALKQTTPNRGETKPVAKTVDKLWLGTQLLLLLCLGGLYYLLRLGFFNFARDFAVRYGRSV